MARAPAGCLNVANWHDSSGRLDWRKAGAGLGVLTLVQVVLGACCGYAWQWAAGSWRAEHLRSGIDELRADNDRLSSDLRGHLLGRLNGTGPFQAVAGVGGHQLPWMYGKVKEKTIWSYWYDPEDCPDSLHCKLPGREELSRISIEVNRGTFYHRLLRKDEVDLYVSKYELPVHWEAMPAAQQRDALMVALLARYGGVALDLSVVLLRPLDAAWDFMLASEATFQGYMYRLNGEHWSRPESTAPFLMMSRRDGILGAAVRRQLIAMGDLRDASRRCPGCEALGDHTLTPILSMFNYSLPRCADDPTVRWHNTSTGGVNESDPRKTADGRLPLVDTCPGLRGPQWSEGASGPPRTDAKLILHDPRDGPQLPMMFSGMELWSTKDEATFEDTSFDNDSWAPMYTSRSCEPEHCAPELRCTSPKSCWEDIFLVRHREQHLRLVRLPEKTDGRSAEQILASKDSYLYNWLKLAGVLDDHRQMNHSFGAHVMDAATLLNQPGWSLAPAA